jgi:hypothetical protein
MLDLIITRNDRSVVGAINVWPPEMSDHFPICFSIKIRKPPIVERTITYRKINAINIDAFREDVGKSSLLQHPHDNLDDLVSQYNQDLSEILDKHAPLIKRTVRLRPHCPWFNEELLQAKRRKRKAQKKAARTKLTIDREILQNERNIMNKLCKEAKAHYYQDMITTNAGNQKALFKIAKELLHKCKSCKLPSFPSPEETANVFINYFRDKIQTIQQSFTSTHSTSERYQQINQNANSQNQPAHQSPNWLPMVSFELVNTDLLKKQILSGNSKTCALDPIPTSLLKKIIDDLLPTLEKIVNKSLSTGWFPTPLKKAIVTPILKKATLDKEILKNYRPVSNLPYLGKLLEKVAVKQITGYKKDNNLYSVFQSAYREYHSTETALVKIMDDVLNSLDRQKCVMLVMLDLSAAFDTIEHQILIERLQADFNVIGTPLSWMRSYLSNRTQAVVVEGVSSEELELSVGLPQGSSVGPSEYVTYSTPVFSIVERFGINVHMYADDTQLYLELNPEDYINAASQMESCLEELKVWMNDNHLKLNEDKTEYLMIGRPSSINRISVPLTLNVGTSVIHASKVAKNIGVVFDTELSMVPHINNLCNQCYVQLRNIAKIRANLTEDTAATLMHAFVSSRLDGCNSLLYGLSDCEIKKLQRVQNSAARIVCGLKKHDHITPALKRLHWLPIQQRITYKICVMVFKTRLCEAPRYLQDIIKPYMPSRHLRSSNANLVQSVKARTRFGERSFRVAGPKLWNGLPSSLRAMTDIEDFKKDLKTYLFRTAFDL